MIERDLEIAERRDKKPFSLGKNQGATFLVKKQETVEECIGDYLGPKIPSLLEFIENKIYMRQVMGLSHVEKTEKAPDHFVHEASEEVF